MHCAEVIKHRFDIIDKAKHVQAHSDKCVIFRITNTIFSFELYNHIFSLLLSLFTTAIILLIRMYSPVMAREQLTGAFVPPA